MKNYDFLTQIFIFLAAITSNIYSVFAADSKEAISRIMILGKFFGSVLVAFFVMPAVQEYFELSLKVTLLLTVVTAYGLENILKVSVKKIVKTIDNGKDDANL